MASKVEKRCPLPRTHNRLRQAHEHWHEALSNYSDPERFCLTLNSLLQSLRSVDDVLDRELKREKDGETAILDWYRNERARLHDDALFDWLRQARNHIVHEGDLDLHSTARVSVEVGWQEPPAVEFHVSPLVGPAEIAERLHPENLPEGVRRDGTLLVERRWVVDTLPDRELLDALAYLYGLLASAVIEAHDRCGVRMQTFGGETHGGRHDRLIHPSGRLPCMQVGTEVRTARWHLRENTLVELEVITHDPPSDVSGLRERYEPAMVGLRAGDPSDGPLQHARLLHEHGKRLLAVDGYHVAIAWLLARDECLQIQLNPEDEQGKHLMFEGVARAVDQAGAGTVIVSTEVWIARAVTPDDRRAHLRAGERDDRREAFVTHLASRDGTWRTYMTPFERPGGKIRLSRTTEDARPVPQLAPVIRAWSRWPAEV